MKPSISIITPCFNSDKTIEKCILSVKNQNKDLNIEHIIIDGKSSDKTVEIIKKYEGAYNIKWVSEKDSGIADAMNKGFKLATGDFVAWIDADNYYDEKVCEHVVDKIKNNSNVDIVCGYISIVDEKESRVFTPNFPFNFEKALLKNTGAIPLQPGTFFKRELFNKINGFNTIYKVAGDYEFWLKVLKLNPVIIYSDMVFGYYKKEDAGASQSIKGIVKGLKEMLLIGKNYNQTFYGKMLLIIKYIRGLLSVYIKRIF
jgi:glycosyltransferase involved in cell wall biosynthesis